MIFDIIVGINKVISGKIIIDGIGGFGIVF